ncbi:hypothetical protein [Saccharopolyspora sp. ASAGF58]|uniref:hypothetical protein n=1 Tax=Saccharopolyspora sp. ASAGF58 TaxID=2719023 RepID=UPI00353048D5
MGLTQSVEEGGRPDCGPVKQELTDCAPANGDVTPLWTERAYVPNAERVTASVGHFCPEHPQPPKDPPRN